MNDEQARQDELQSITAIFEDIVEIENETRIVAKFDDTIELIINLPTNYPSRSPPLFELCAPSLNAEHKSKIVTDLKAICQNRVGEPILYEWIQYLNSYANLNSKNYMVEEHTNTTADEPLESSSSASTAIKPIVSPRFISGDVICDRRSAFQAHVAAIQSEEEAHLVLNKLKENGKIARATHKIYAWSMEKVVNGRSIKQHDCEDDGETGAGGKLLNLLDLMKAKNVIVIVTRWYGGIHLGPDRFKHICNVARQALIQNGFSNR